MNDFISAKTQDALGTFVVKYFERPTPLRHLELSDDQRIWLDRQYEICTREHYHSLYLAAKRFVESYEAHDLKE